MLLQGSIPEMSPLYLLGSGEWRVESGAKKGLLMPTAAVRNVTDISMELIRELEIDAILLDVDNTLAPPTSHIAYEGVHEWIDMLKENNIAVVICSNNYRKRVKPFSDSVGLNCVSMSLKPLPFGFNRAKRKLKEKPQSVLVAGMKSVLLVPRDEEHGLTIWIRRKLEIRIRKKIKILGE